MFLEDDHTIRYCAQEKIWYYFDGRRWIPDRILRIPNLVREALRRKGWDILDWAEKNGDAKEVAWAKRQARRLGSFSLVSAVEKFARGDKSIAVTPELFDADPWILNTPGGIVDLHTGKMRPSMAGDYCTKMTTVTPAGECPMWMGFLDLVTAGDKELQGYLQHMAGYFLTGSVREHALFFMCGAGGNGKSTFLDTWHDILGDDYATGLPLNALMSNKGDHIPVEVAKLRGHRLAITDETEYGKAWNEAKVKTLTGGDILCGRALYQNLFDFHPTHKLIVAGNLKPSFRIVDDAIRRRLHLIPFEVKIEHPDKKFRDRLRPEWGGILNWAVQGCLEWQRQGLNPPDRILVPSQEYLAEQDSLGEWIRECCVAAGEAAIRYLYFSWRNWCLMRGEEPGAMRTFSLRLAGVPNVSKIRMGHTRDRGFAGISLKGETADR
jgi:putative DNA primase/helicase